MAGLTAGLQLLAACALMAVYSPLLAGVFLARGLLSWMNAVLAQRSAAAVKSQLRTEIMAARRATPPSSRPG